MAQKVDTAESDRFHSLVKRGLIGMDKRYLVVGTTTESVILTAEDSDDAVLIFEDTFRDVEFSRFEVTELEEGDKIK